MPEYGHHSAMEPPLLVYAVGDIHGSLRKLKDLLAQCEQHADGRPAAFVFLGDYIDRGPDSSGVTATLMELQSRRPERVIALKGNHEAFALGVLDGEVQADIWLREGGTATLRSYGVSEPGALPREHVTWWRSLPLRYDDGSRFFVHAGVDPATPLDAQRDDDLLWIREPFLSDPRDYGRLVVHGHTPQPNGLPDLRANRLNVDTGAVFGGPLTAAIFAAGRRDPVGFVQAE